MTSERKQILIDPDYLLLISSNVETINYFYEQQSMGSLSTEYRNLLLNSFANLNENLQLYSTSPDSSSMCQASVLKCKGELEVYCLDKLALLLNTETQEIGKLLQKISKLYRENMEDFERIIQSERRKRSEETENEKDFVIRKLKEELKHRKEYISELKERLEEVEEENSKIYHRMIGNAKNVSDRVLSLSPKKKSISANSPALTKFKPESMFGTAHQTISVKQVEETIVDIMQTKLKQEENRAKRTNIKQFLKTYFKNKFGITELAEETEQKFKEAVEFFSHEKNIIILFSKIISEECDERYFSEQKSLISELNKVVKKFLNYKYQVSYEDFDRFCEQKTLSERSEFNLNEADIEVILKNIYSKDEASLLEMMEIIMSKIDSIDPSETDQFQIPSKKFVNEILNYELNKHLLRIDDIVKVIGDIDDGRGYLNAEDLETAIARLKIPDEKVQLYVESGDLEDIEDRFLSHSEVIEIIEKIRKIKAKRK